MKLDNGGHLWIIGDFNASVGIRRRGEENFMGSNNFGRRNKRGEELINFCSEENLKIVNTFFNDVEERKWTWKSPRGKMYEIDYMLTKHIDGIKSFNVVENLKCSSDHRMIQANIATTKKAENL